MLLGCLLNVNPLLKMKNINAIIICIISFILSVEIKGGSIDIIMRYLNPINVLLSVILFSIFHFIEDNSNNRVLEIDRLCFGVYLIHPIFIRFSYRYLHITPIGNLYPIAFIVFCCVIIMVSFG